MRTTRQKAKSRDREAKKRAAKRDAQKAGRRLVLSSGTWTWTVGLEWVVIRDPHNMSYRVPLDGFGGVTPGLVRQYIETTLPGGEAK
jgi:hypothetical protein